MVISAPRTRHNTHIAERLAVNLSLPVLRIMSVAAGIRTPHLPFEGVIALTHCATGAANHQCVCNQLYNQAVQTKKAFYQRR